MQLCSSGNNSEVIVVAAASASAVVVVVAAAAAAAAAAAVVVAYSRIFTENMQKAYNENIVQSRRTFPGPQGCKQAR